MKCKNCGMEFEGVFCPNCGMKSEETKEEINAKADMKSVEKDNLHMKDQDYKAGNTIANRPSIEHYNNGTAKKDKKIFGIWSLILGIVGVCTFGVFFVPEILAIVFGVVSIKTEKASGVAIAGLVCGGVAMFLVICCMIIGSVL